MGEKTPLWNVPLEALKHQLGYNEDEKWTYKELIEWKQNKTTFKEEQKIPGK